MAYDLQNTYSTLSLIKDVVTGGSVTREGQLLVRSMEGGVEKVAVCTAVKSLVPVGFAISDNSSDTTAAMVETVTVPDSPGPYTVTLQHSPRAGIGSNLEEVSVRLASNWATALTQVDDSTPSSGEVDCADDVLTFNSAQAGLTYIVSYRYTLSAPEAKMKWYQRNINNTAGAELGQVVLLTGQGQIYTHEYDVQSAWGGTTTTVYTGADGVLTLDTTGTDISASVRVIKVPSSENAALGVAFSFIP